ncbi:MAG: polyhydroxyalkanoic acid system family protein [Chitinophagaceae bacterium]|nr:polyhydroxyalkanoic acid system family protein [Chitinophagaceae bacterium]
MKIEVPHRHTKEEAQQKIKDLLGGLKEKYSDKINNIEEKWEGDTNNFTLGVGPFSTSGNIQVKDKQVDIELSIPMFAGMFKDQIKKLIEEQARQVLG